MGVVTNLLVVDVIPSSDSSETDDSSEPSVAVDPLNTNQIVVGAYGVYVSPSIVSPFFTSIDGGTAWTTYGELDHNDKSLAWSQDGSTLFAATLVDTSGNNAEINTYSGTISGSDFGSPINTFNPVRDLDQPWIRTGSGGEVYVAYNDITSTGVDTANVLVSSNGGSSYTSAALDRNSGSIIQDAPAVRLAVNGATVYGAFTRWTSVLDSNADETRYNADVYVVRSDSGGADGFDALGSGGLGVNVASPTGWFADTSDGSLTLGKNRTGAGSELAIAVDPNNAGHVVIAYGTAPGASIDSGELGLVVTESFDSGSSWAQKFATPVTSGGIKSSMPAVAIAADGMIAMLYCSYDPSTDELSQQLLTTNDDFATSSTITLATESNAAAPAPIDPYLGDFYDLTCIGNTFYGIFAAANADNGTDASFPTVTFQRSFTGTAGTSNFQLVTSSGGSPVSASIDPFFFSFMAAVTVSSGTTIVSSATNESYIVVDSGTLEVASGGTVSGEITISSGGSVLIDSGGTVLDTLISSGGVLQVSSGGVADPTTIVSGGTEIVSAGGTDSGALISGGEQDVFGVASGATVFNGGFEVVSSGGAASATVVSSGGTLELLSGGSVVGALVYPGGSLAVGAGTPNVTGLRIIDVIPASDSAETDQNSEPSLAVNPLAPTQIIAGAFGNGLPNPYFETTNGGTTWLDYGELDHVDKSLAWSPDGSTAFTATLVAVGPVNAEIKTYSGTTSGSDFGSPINTFNPAHDLDQPWIRTGPSGHVYVAYNDLTSAGTDAGGTGNGETGVCSRLHERWFRLHAGRARSGRRNELSRRPGGALGGQRRHRLRRLHPLD